MENLKELLLEMGYSNISDSGREYRMKPIYRDSSSDTVLSVRKDTGFFIDFSKNISGSFKDLVKLSLKLEKVEDAENWLENKDYSIVKEDVEKPKIKEPKTFPKETLTKLIQDHSYWIKRGISPATVETFGGGIVKVGRMANRYVFPIFNYKKEFVGVSGRYIEELPNEKTPKWKHIGDKSDWKYPLQINNKLIRKEKEVILVESIGDMLALWEAEIKNVIVIFGLQVSLSVINYLLRIDAQKIYIALNNDEGGNFAGNEAASKNQKRLLKYFDSHQVCIAFPYKKDFGEMNTEEISEWYKQEIEQKDTKNILTS